jgi:hypothetical protein
MKPEKIRRSAAQEKHVAKAVGGHVQKGSGSGWVHRNDVKSEQYLIEVKGKTRKDAKSITISLEALEGNYVNGFSINKLPTLAFELGGRFWYIECEEVRALGGKDTL